MPFGIEITVAAGCLPNRQSLPGLLLGIRNCYPNPPVTHRQEGEACNESVNFGGHTGFAKESHCYGPTNSPQRGLLRGRVFYPDYRSQVPPEDWRVLETEFSLIVSGGPQTRHGKFRLTRRQLTDTPARFGG